MFEWATEERLSKDAKDTIAEITLQRFREAVVWQGSEQVGDRSLRRTLQECHDQLHSIMSPLERERADELGVHATINLTAMKVGVVQSFLSEALLQPDMSPWSIAPTPIPSLSETGRQEALLRVKERVFSNDPMTAFTGDVTQLIREVKASVMRQEKETAERAAQAMLQLMTDQCAEGGWRGAVKAFLTDFATYPFAVMHGPVPTRRPRLIWNKDKLQTKMQTFYEFRHISPFDFWYSPDSRDSQTGTSIFIRQRWTRQRLEQAMGMKSYIADSIADILYDTEKDDQYNFKWMSPNPDQPGDALVMWTNCSATIDALVAFGMYSGKELRTVGITSVDDRKFYDATVTIIGGRTVQAYIQPDLSANFRPVHTASFYKITDRIPGHGIAQRIRDVDRAYQTVFRYMIRNAANVSEPITEADYTRLSKYLTDDDLTALIPGGFYLADGDIATNNPALRFYSIPSVLPQYGQVLQGLMDLGHLVTNIPAALHGMAVGTGVNRTFRGAAMLQGNAVKAITDAVGNFDETVLGPLGTLLFNYNMLYEDDEAIKGDCQIVAQGVQGLLQKELNQGKLMEVMQFLGAAGAQLGPIGPYLFLYVVKDYLRLNDLPEELLRGLDMSTIQQAQMQAPAPAQNPSGAPPDASAPLPVENM